MKKVLALAALLLSVSNSAVAKSYQAQGCGLGSTLFTDGSSLVHQVLGATTNGSSGNATFGMTSGTSNCELEAMKGKRAQTIFIEANRVALANDVARGHGDTLNSLARMYGCTQLSNVGPALQKNFNAVFSSESASASQIDSSIMNVLRTEKACI